MGVLSVAKHLASQARRRLARAVKNPAARARRGMVRAVLKSSVVNSVQNAVLRCVAGEVLLAGAVLLATALTASADSPVYNFVAPCVVSAACTEFLREPLNAACDVYTQPLADRVQRVVAHRWFDESFWFGVKGCVGITLGAVAVTLSYFNDVHATTIFVCQSLLTSMAMGIAKNPQHPVRGWVRRAFHRYYLDRPSTRRFVAAPPPLHDTYFSPTPMPPAFSWDKHATTVFQPPIGRAASQGPASGLGATASEEPLSPHALQWYGSALHVLGGACLNALDHLAGNLDATGTDTPGAVRTALDGDANRGQEEHTASEVAGGGDLDRDLDRDTRGHRSDSSDQTEETEEQGEEQDREQDRAGVQELCETEREHMSDEEEKEAEETRALGGPAPMSGEDGARAGDGQVCAGSVSPRTLAPLSSGPAESQPDLPGAWRPASITFV